MAVPRSSHLTDDLPANTPYPFSPREPDSSSSSSTSLPFPGHFVSESSFPRGFHPNSNIKGHRSSSLASMSAGRQVSTHHPFIAFVIESQILSCLLSFLPWTDFLALTQTCQRCRSTFTDHHLRDVILTRYVEGYGHCLRNRDQKLSNANTVFVTLHDLDLLLISQSTPLHTYPTHSLSILSSLLPTTSQQTKSQKLASLAQAHSRFVLLIQSLAHSSYHTLEPDPEPPVGYQSVSRHAMSSISGSRFSRRPRRHRVDDILPNGDIQRELRFPAPLSYSVPKDALIDRRTVRPDQGLESKSILSSDAHYSTAPSSFQTHRTNGTLKRKNRASFLGGKGNTPLPPMSEPNALKYHSWRQHPSSHSRRTSRQSFRASVDSWLSEDDSPLSSSDAGHLTVDELGKPMPHFAHKFSSSDSSLGSGSSLTSVSGGTPPTSIPSPSRSSQPSPSSSTFYSPKPKALHPSLLSTSPHDLTLATSRVRAPVLRVFVPCVRFSEQSAVNSAAMGSVEQCEEQLIEAGLWEHLSTGDVVVNLGYVPESAGGSSTTPSEDEGDDPGLVQGTKRQQKKAAEPQKWLIFNGEILVPFSPEQDTVPHEDPWCLPSPWYYDHITPSPRLSPRKYSDIHPTMILKRLPSFSSDNPQLSLINCLSKVKSPHSKGGIAIVQKWIWVARIWCAADFSHSGLELGVGWEGEWILESEGTKEGRQKLLESTKGFSNDSRRWELVRERSGGGRIWIRIIN